MPAARVEGIDAVKAVDIDSCVLCTCIKSACSKGLRNSLADKCESGAQVGRSRSTDAHLLSRPLLESFPVEQQGRRPIAAPARPTSATTKDDAGVRANIEHTAAQLVRVQSPAPALAPAIV